MNRAHFDSVHIIDGFVDEISLDYIAKMIANSEYGDSTAKPQGEDGYRDSSHGENILDSIARYSPASVILKPSEDYPVRPAIDPIMLKIHSTIQKLWDRECFLETNYSVLGYKVGESLKAHHDAIYNLKTNTGYPRCDISAVLYLNDDYSGGELSFVKQKIKIKPKAGSVVIFPSTEKFTHYVNKITFGMKFFVPSLWCFQ
jgi:hypothetical protein